MPKEIDRGSLVLLEESDCVSGVRVRFYRAHDGAFCVEVEGRDPACVAEVRKAFVAEMGPNSEVFRLVDGVFSEVLLEL